MTLLPSTARTLEWQNTWWDRENVQRRLEMSFQPVWILYNRTWHQKISSTKLSCIQILCHNLVWVNIWCAVVNVYSFQGAVLKRMDKQHNYQIIPFWQLVHCRQLLDWNLSFRTPLLQGHLNSGDENWVAEKCLHNPCICYLYLRDTSTQGKGTPFPGFTPDSGDTLAYLTGLSTKRVDKFKCRLVNDSFHNMNYLT